LRSLPLESRYQFGSHNVILKYHLRKLKFLVTSNAIHHGESSFEKVDTHWLVSLVFKLDRRHVAQG
jgi:hypothetical protein